MKHNTLVTYLPETHEFKIVAPTPELHERAKGLPAARNHKRGGFWIVPASPATMARILRRFHKKGLEITPAFRTYWDKRVEAAKASQTVLQMKDSSLPAIPETKIQPEGKWLHQRRAFWFAFPLEAAMLDVTMGGGKTKVAIDLMQNWRARDVLIIAPLAAIEDAWEPHLEKHMLHDYNVVKLDSGTLVKRTERAREQYEMPATLCDEGKQCNYPECECPMSYAPLDTAHRITIINHESFWREPFATWAAGKMWDLVIDDEVHREKSAGSLCSKYLHRLGMRARRRLGLTGTVMPHSPLDVYGQFRFLDRGIFGTNHSKFEERYGLFGGYEGREIIGFHRVPELKRKISTITIHIDDAEQGLPKTIDLRHSVKLEPAAKRAYQEMEKEFVAEFEQGIMTAANSGVKLLRLHQLASGIATMDEEQGSHRKKREIRRISTAKLQGLQDSLADLRRDEPIVIFVRFRPDITAVLELCTKLKRSVSELSGTANELAKWKQGHADVLVAQIQAAKEGIDLTRSSVGIFFSTGISLGDYLQCRKRLHRPPQSRMVRFIHILASGTKDVSTMRALSERHDVIKSVLKEIGRRKK